MPFAAAFAPGEGVQGMQLELLMGVKGLHPCSREGGGGDLPALPPWSRLVTLEMSLCWPRREGLCAAANTGAVRAGGAGSRCAQRPPLFAEKCLASVFHPVPTSFG